LLLWLVLLVLNPNHSSEVIVRSPLAPAWSRVTEVKILGVTVTKHLNFNIYFINVNAKNSPFRCMDPWAHGLRGANMHDVTMATVVARMLYLAPAWWRFFGLGCELESKPNSGNWPKQDIVSVVYYIVCLYLACDVQCCAFASASY